jgi:hypothetical protein
MERGESATAGVRTYPIPFGRRIRGPIRGRSTGRLQKAGNTALNGGWGGIRTHDTLLTYTHFPGARLRPLGHPSKAQEPRPVCRTAASRAADHSQPPGGGQPTSPAQPRNQRGCRRSGSMESGARTEIGTGAPTSSPCPARDAERVPMAEPRLGEGTPPLPRQFQAKRGITLVQNCSIDRIRTSCGTRPL